jgi:hypothetical protein
MAKRIAYWYHRLISMNMLHGTGIYTGPGYTEHIGFHNHTTLFIIDDYGNLIPGDRAALYVYFRKIDGI